MTIEQYRARALELEKRIIPSENGKKSAAEIAYAIVNKRINWLNETNLSKDARDAAQAALSSLETLLRSPHLTQHTLIYDMLTRLQCEQPGDFVEILEWAGPTYSAGPAPEVGRDFAIRPRLFHTWYRPCQDASDSQDPVLSTPPATGTYG